MRRESLRFGYTFWGFLSDEKFDKDKNPLSTPDGNATYSWSIFWEAQRRGWNTYSMMPNRDVHSTHIGFERMFGSFSMQKRMSAYANSLCEMHYQYLLPDLDVLLLEWRFPIPGRNVGVPKDDPAYQPDLDIQTRLLEYYKAKDTKILIFDLDHKLTLEDELKWEPDAILETSVSPRRLSMDRVRVEPPFLVDDLLQHPTLPCDPHRKLVYVGSRYERDDVIQEYLYPASEAWEGDDRIELWGNWTRPENLAYAKEHWPKMRTFGRITTKDFHRVYGDAVACPLLAKRSYIETGFITPRVWEALLFGTIPVGLAQMNGIDQYVLHAAKDSQQMKEIADELSSMPLADRDVLRKRSVEKIRFMDASNFVDRLRDVADGSIVRKPVPQEKS